MDEQTKKLEVRDAGLDIGRRVKARRIAEAIRKLGGGAHEAQQLSDADWLNADKLSVQQTGHGGPKRGKEWQAPSLETRALVIEYLSRPEAPEAIECPARDEDVPNR